VYSNINTDIANHIVSNIEDQGYIVLSTFFPQVLLDKLLERIKTFNSINLKEAAIGRGFVKQKNRDIRCDKIQWLNSENEVDKLFLEAMEDLRKLLNQQLFLGLFDYESHYAVYEKEDFYKKHIDALKGKSNRVFSTVLYLNDKWSDFDAGELVLYTENGKTILETIQPNSGTLVLFLSEQFPHEVLATNKTRYSIAGWFRTNASDSKEINTSN